MLVRDRRIKTMNLNLSVNKKRSVTRKNGINDNQKIEIYNLYKQKYGINAISKITNLSYDTIYYWLVTNLNGLIAFITVYNMWIKQEEASNK